MSRRSASKSPASVGVVGHEGDLAVEVLALGLPVEDLPDHRLRLLECRGGEPSDGEVGKQVVAVDGRESGVGGGPDVGRSLEEERHRGGLRGGVEVPRVVVGVSEEEDVAGRRASPLVVGEGEEVADGLGGGLTASEGGGDLLEGGGERGEALGLAAQEKGLCRVEEGPRGDEDVVGLVPGGAQSSGGLGEEDAGREEGLLGDGEVAVPGLGAEAQRRSGLVAGEPGGGGRDVEERGGRGDPGDLGRSGGREGPVEGPGLSRRELGMDELEAVEEDARTRRRCRPRSSPRARWWPPGARRGRRPPRGEARRRRRSPRPRGPRSRRPARGGPRRRRRRNRPGGTRRAAPSRPTRRRGLRGRRAWSCSPRSRATPTATGPRCRGRRARRSGSSRRRLYRAKTPRASRPGPPGGGSSRRLPSHARGRRRPRGRRRWTTRPCPRGRRDGSRGRTGPNGAGRRRARGRGRRLASGAAR